MVRVVKGGLGEWLIENEQEVYPPLVFADEFPDVNLVEITSVPFVYMLNIPLYLQCKQDSHASDQDAQGSLGTSWPFSVYPPLFPPPPEPITIVKCAVRVLWK